MNKAITDEVMEQLVNLRTSSTKLLLLSWKRNGFSSEMRRDAISKLMEIVGKAIACELDQDFNEASTILDLELSAWGVSFSHQLDLKKSASQGLALLSVVIGQSLFHANLCQIYLGRKDTKNVFTNLSRGFYYLGGATGSFADRLTLGPSVHAKFAGSQAHSFNRQRTSAIIAWYEKNRSKFASKNQAAIVIAEKFNVSPKTARDKLIGL